MNIKGQGFTVENLAIALIILATFLLILYLSQYYAHGGGEVANNGIDTIFRRVG